MKRSKPSRSPAASGRLGRTNPRVQLQLPPQPAAAAIHALSEHEGKAALAAFGVRIPRGTARIRICRGRGGARTGISRGHQGFGGAPCSTRPKWAAWSSMSAAKPMRAPPPSGWQDSRTLCWSKRCSRDGRRRNPDRRHRRSAVRSGAGPRRRRRVHGNPGRQRQPAASVDARIRSNRHCSASACANC